MNDETINFLIYFTEKNIEKSKKKIMSAVKSCDKNNIDWTVKDDSDLLNFHMGEVAAYQNALQAIKAQLKSQECEEDNDERCFEE
tara:strand:+ start:372 stop:626 length:255 start_codon:yes stop_codon:yes gene_type:complete